MDKRPHAAALVATTMLRSSANPPQRAFAIETEGSDEQGGVKSALSVFYL
jgi:hypothetical protein